MEPKKKKEKRIGKPRKPLGKKIAKTSANPLIVALHARGKTVTELANGIGAAPNSLAASFRNYKVPSAALEAILRLGLNRRWLGKYGYAVSAKRSSAKVPRVAKENPLRAPADRFSENAREIWEASGPASRLTVSRSDDAGKKNCHPPEGALARVKKAAAFVRGWKDLETLAAGLRSQLSPGQMEVLGLMVAYGA